MKPILPVAASSVAVLISGLGAANLRETITPSGRPPGLEAHETHASASLLGQFRTTFSGWLWLRTDLYLHNGTEMRPLTDGERKQGGKGSSSKDNEDGGLHDDSAITTVVPSPAADFRGIFGDIERATHAYRDMRHHTHNDPWSALPLFRLMTWIDPTFIPGWTTGANVLSRDHTEEGVAKALDFLEQGRKKNPESVALCGEIGHLMVARKHDMEGAAAILERARSFSKRGDRPLSEDDQEALPDVYRWLAMIYRERGMLDRMYAVLREGTQRIPDDRVLDRMLNMPPSPLRPKHAPSILDFEKAAAAKREPH
jgi:hypothetical protein